MRRLWLKNTDPLIAILVYIKVYPTFDVMGVLFGASHSRCCWIRDFLSDMNHLLILSKPIENHGNNTLTVCNFAVRRFGMSLSIRENIPNSLQKT